MAVAVANPMLLTDGDIAFLRVDNRRPAHALEPGVAASATNKRFDQGKAGPRFGIALDPWGKPMTNLVTGDYPSVPPFSAATATTVTLVVGERYRYIAGNSTGLGTALLVAPPPSGAVSGLSGDAIPPGIFTATQVTYYIVAPVALAGTAVTAEVYHVANTCAYKRFSDPVTDTDQTILITDDWRDGVGEDGGRGRAWRILPGNGPQDISLNGHDVWGTARLEQCHHAMALARHGNQRHYFVAADVDTTADTINLHTLPNIGTTAATAQRVRYELATPGSAIYGASAPAAGNYYYALRTTGNLIELYSDAACTNKMVFDANPIGKFYIEFATNPAPFFGNGAVPLILQPDGAGNNAFETGFKSIPTNTAVTSTTAASLTAPNHRLAPGDAILLDGLTVGGVAQTFIPPVTTFYAYPTSEHTFTIHTTAQLALTGTTPIATITTPDTGQVKKLSAAGMPLPPLREIVYLAGRLWGVNGDDELVFSDPFDFLHYTRFVSQVPANQGEAGAVKWLRPLGEDVMAIGKEQKIIGLSGISGATSGFREGTITTEYGGVAALAAINVGTDLQFASRKGWASIIRTIAGERLGTSRTVSAPIPQDLADIDWSNAHLMCAENWNGRMFWGVPTKGQAAGEVVNNKVLVLNYNNSQLYVEQSVVDGDIVGGVRVAEENAKGPDSWEGSWTGDLLIPYGFAKLKVNGEERLTWATPDGLVCWFHDGWDDAGAVIGDELVTRGYFGSRETLALKGAFKWETFQPSLSAYVRSAGYQEEEQLAGFDELAYDRTQYLIAGQTDYDPNTSTIETFDLPHRSDYSPAPEELLVARLDVHQAITEPFGCRVRDHSIQFRIVNEQGSARLCAVTVQGKAVGISATRKS